MLAAYPKYYNEVLFNTGFMNFAQFNNSLGYIAIKIYHEKSAQQPITMLLSNYILNLETNLKPGYNNISQCIDNLKQDQGIRKLLDLIKKSMMPFYKYYSICGKFLDLNGFLKLCSDFDIFPALCSKPFIVRIFGTLVNISLLNDENIAASKPTIDYNAFMESFAVIAFEAPFPSNLSKEERVYCLIRFLGWLRK